MNKNYFDLHFHPLAKNHLAPQSKDTYKDGHLTKPINMSKAFKDYTEETILRRLESQSCIAYLREGHVGLGVAAIAALEFGLAASKGFVADILESNLKKPFDLEYFEAVKEGELSYLNLFLQEVELYRKLRDEAMPKLQQAGSLNLIKRYPDKQDRKSDSRPKLVFAIEGGHNLCMKKIGNTLEYDEFTSFNNNFFDPSTVISRERKDPAMLLQKLVGSFRESGMDILYLTLTHLTHIPEQHLATHAFGLKTLKHPSFYPFGNGLTALGKEVIKRAYELKIQNGQHKTTSKQSNGKDTDLAAPVLIDIKHLSLKSREDLYEFRKKNKYNSIPLIASHVGVTGYSIHDWKDNLMLKKCVNHVDQGIKTVKIYTQPKMAGYWGGNIKKEFTFNPCTINLMDEDIIEVANSKGLIGLTLNMDLLGDELNSSKQDDNYEFMTTADFISYFPYNSLKALDYAGKEEMQAEEAWLSPPRRDLHPLNLCYNILHIMAVIGMKTIGNDKPEKFICIGSDFDGFIETTKICSDSRRMKDLEASLLKWLPVAAVKYQKVNGGTKDLFEFTKKKKVLDKVVAAILYENGKNFLEQQGFMVASSENSETPQSSKKQAVAAV
ncbi:MAG: hypothetical protein ABJN95_18270 [Maribacter sp.]|uniref:hypothetical protein n=1 Tax=Maribacter sp. TaxID=1897614 RepID=UPI003299DB7E